MGFEPWERPADWWKPKDSDGRDDRGGVAVLDVPDTKEYTKQGRKKIGDSLDVVLAASPEAYDRQDIVIAVADMVNRRLNLSVYCPLEERMDERKVGQIMKFTLREAIPKTRAVLMYLGYPDKYFKQMLSATLSSKKPFVLFRSEDDVDLGPEARERVLRNDQYFGDIVYSCEQDALDQLEGRLREIPKLRG